MVCVCPSSVSKCNSSNAVVDDFLFVPSFSHILGMVLFVHFEIASFVCSA